MGNLVLAFSMLGGDDGQGEMSKEEAEEKEGVWRSQGDSIANLEVASAACDYDVY